MRTPLAAIVLVVFSALRASAAWLEVSPHSRVNPDAVVAVELRTDVNGSSEATIRTQSAEHIVRTPSVVQEIRSMAADTAGWFKARGETVGQKTISRYIRKSAVIFVKYSCPSSASCSAFADGPDSSFSRVVVDDSGAVAELKQQTADAAQFTLVDSPGSGFEGFVRRAAIRSVSFICQNTTTCTQADVTLLGRTLITRDAAGIQALRAISTM